MKRLHLIIILVCVSMTTSIATLGISWFFSTTAIQELPMTVSVGEVFGLAVSEDMDFGMVRPGAGSIKIFYVYGDEKPHIVNIEATGEMGPWTSFVPNNFRIEPYEEVNITVAVNVPYGVEIGDYTGTMIVRMSKP